MNGRPQQLAFDLPHRPAFGLEDFLVSQSNAEAVALIDRWPDWPVGAAIVAGPRGSGKSHLASVWRSRSHATVCDAADLDRGEVPALIRAGALVIEDVGAVRDQPALFHLLNLVREQRIAVLLTAHAPPGDLEIGLPDLSSRLRALPVAIIAPPDDALLRAVLVKLFDDRQLSVEPHVIDYAVLRMERSMAAARALVHEIDRRALVLQRRVTRAIAAQALESIGP